MKLLRRLLEAVGNVAHDLARRVSPSDDDVVAPEQDKCEEPEDSDETDTWGVALQSPHTEESRALEWSPREGPQPPREGVVGEPLAGSLASRVQRATKAG